ncbi:hypothetical protein EMIHUDRAFT_468530 [Emiliania huxleyi CCMP1516]|uniref:Glycoside hydrolase family 2 catalytic domain-containing protein n=2 Tax=Emiliania huxleyi TaxID=2903 RepID=A0A0D3K1C3_EMIH1|nr:hypothetical protein EMIHUDRAFT_468530 [Emiliania huxleyi CCMP1516]EOD29558.1 hypothetical protein EMIHUDRAFT_468530 [Emiliania huxleyi CCMP1516]|eukprot:XP_005781987.1 hypothetical protein EMIHUDRAFT_468530 [Emiliania huxleyi CCMP1516]
MADTWGTLRPSDSAHRRCTQLDGLWAFIADHKDDGHASGFCSGLPESGRTPIAVPASWNEQLPELDSFLGPAWYERTVWAPLGLTPRQRVCLRFGSVNYSCEVYFNGERAGAHEGGHLPFEVDVTCLLRSSGEPNLLVLRVDGRLEPTHVPPGGGWGAMAPGCFPRASFDFYPFCGVQRSVQLCVRPASGLEGLKIETRLEGLTAGAASAASVLMRCRCGTGVSRALDADGAPIDSYEQRLGLRTVEASDDGLLLNGEPVSSRSTLPHPARRFPAGGARRGANSYRTAHYPYSEVDLDLADEHGLLVVSESPCVGLSFADAPAIVQQRQAQATRALAELLARDCCRTCVVAWSVCNEPGGPQSVPTAEAKRQQTEALLELVALARAEGTRLVTFANIPEHCDEANRACDFLSLNEYVGWYYDVGKPLAEIGRQLEAKFVALHADFRKPIMVSECGADTLPGCHMMAPGLWSEEFQAGLLEVYTELERKLPFVFGVHVWNLADFRTPQMHLRAAGLNHKGVFTRLREPKLAAHMLRRAWRP